MNQTSTNDIRVLLIDDHALFREGLARLIQSESGFNMVGHCSSGSEAIRILKTQLVDVVLLDLDLGPETGSEFLDNLKNIEFKGKVLVVTAGVNERDIPDLIRKGIVGILMKHNSPGLLLQGIRDTVQGKVWFDQQMLRKAFAFKETRDAESKSGAFTERERTVLSFVFEGLSNKEIADRIEVSESAVKSTLQHLFTKTGVRTRSQLVRVALEQHRDEL